MDVYEILNSHKSDIEKLKSKLDKTNSELENMKSKYQFLLEKMLELSSKPKKKETPIAARNLSISSNQLLLMLKQGQAINSNYAVSSIQIKAAFNLKKSERTIRNKLNELETTGHVSSIDGRPKLFYLSEYGSDYLLKQSKDILNVF